MQPRFLGFLLLFLTISAFGDTAALARAHSEAFARAMNASDINAAFALYAEDSHVVWPGQGEEARGKIAIRALIDFTPGSFPKDSLLALQSQEAIALEGRDKG
jgi:ketosteroid isomerase-like protein